jgi:hypothetical protein
MVAGGARRSMQCLETLRRGLPPNMFLDMLHHYDNESKVREEEFGHEFLQVVEIEGVQQKS